MAIDWLPIACAPKDGTRIIGIDAFDNVDIYDWFKYDGFDGAWHDCHCMAADSPLTHWMPIPAPPVRPAAKPITPVVVTYTYGNFGCST